MIRGSGELLADERAVFFQPTPEWVGRGVERERARLVQQVVQIPVEVPIPVDGIHHIEYETREVHYDLEVQVVNEVPETKVVELITEQIVEVPYERVVEKIVEVEEIEFVEVPVDRVVEYIVERIVEVPVEKVVEVKRDIVVEKINHVPYDKVVERIVEIPVDKIVEKVVERVVTRIVEVPVERVVTRYVEVPYERVEENKREVEYEKVVEKVVEVPVEKVVEKIVEYDVPIEKIIEMPIEKVIQQVVKLPGKVVEREIIKHVEVEEDLPPIELGMPPIGAAASATDTRVETHVYESVIHQPTTVNQWNEVIEVNANHQTPIVVPAEHQYGYYGSGSVHGGASMYADTRHAVPSAVSHTPFMVRTPSDMGYSRTPASVFRR